MLNVLRRDLLSRRPMPIRWSISQPQTDEHRVWVQCSHLTVSVSLWVLTLGISVDRGNPPPPYRTHVAEVPALVRRQHFKTAVFHGLLQLPLLPPTGGLGHEQ